MKWRFRYLRVLAWQVTSRSYWRMGREARRLRRIRIRHEPIILRGEAAEKALEILQRRGKLPT
jgi:hypothetical protein